MSRIILVVFLVIVYNAINANRVEAISHENEMFLIRQAKPYLFEATTQLGDVARIGVQTISRSQQCGGRETMQHYKQLVNRIMHLDFHHSYFACVEKYDHWNLDQEKTYSDVQRIKIVHMIASCVENAKRFTQNQIFDIMWKCINVKRLH